MYILIISPFFPLPLKSGGRTRLFNIIKHLSFSHTIDFISLIREEEKKYISDLMRLCKNVITVNVDDLIGRNQGNIIRGSNLRRVLFRLVSLMKGIPLEISGFYFRELHAKVNAKLQSIPYDVVQVELTRTAQYLDWTIYKNHPSRKIIVDYDLAFIPHLRRYQCAKTPIAKLIRYMDYKLHRSFALKTWPLFDKLVVMSEIDRKKILELLPQLSVLVVPNGVDLSYFSPLPREEGDNRLLFVGGTEHFPNIDALLYFTKEIFPRLRNLMNNISLTVIGDGWESYRDQLVSEGEIQFTGYVDDVRCYARGQTVMIAPIRIGGGTRLKILEAMAMGVPVVSTSIGCEGINAERGQHIMVADTTEEFANGIMAIFSNSHLCNALRENAYEFVRKNYGWDKLALKMECVYRGENAMTSLSRSI